VIKEEVIARAHKGLLSLVLASKTWHKTAILRSQVTV